MSWRSLGTPSAVVSQNLGFPSRMRGITREAWLAHWQQVTCYESRASTLWRSQPEEDRQ